MPLTDTAVRKAKPREKAYRLTDGRGLYLEVSPAGGKWWRLKYRFGGKENRLSMGVYPDVPLKLARERRDEARRLLANGIDPGVKRKLDKTARAQAAANSFEAVAREWYAKFQHTWADTYKDKMESRLRRDIFPWLGARPIAGITAPELLTVLRRVEGRGALDTAHRERRLCGEIFRYAIATGRAERDPSQDLRGALPPPIKRRFPTITDPKEVGALLRAIDGYSGTFPVICALKLAPLLFVRPGELRAARWAEFDLDNGLWRIPGERMKMKSDHLVPLSTQAVAILRELYPLTGRGVYVFPSARHPRGDRRMSENAVNAALRRLGYDRGQIVGHGFRGMASTLLHEAGWSSDAIERQLAHAERNEIKAAYNRAEHLPERIKMMQWWADYLDGLRNDENVALINAAR